MTSQNEDGSSLSVGVDFGSELIKVVAVSASGVEGVCERPYEGVPLVDEVRSCLEGIVDKKDRVSHRTFTGSVPRPEDFTMPWLASSLCAARGIEHVAPGVRIGIGVGAESVEVVSQMRGVPLKVVRNQGCAATAGRYLQIVADVLGVSVHEVGERALCAERTLVLSSTCAVFAESEVIGLVHAGHDPNSIFQAACDGLASRIYSLLLQLGHDSEPVILYGGVARNVAFRRAMESRIGGTVYVPENPSTVCALGAALLGWPK